MLVSILIEPEVGWSFDVLSTVDTADNVAAVAAAMEVPGVF